jgi:MraZ protein
MGICGENMLLTGCFNRALDDKLRVAIPKRLRDDLGQVDQQGMYLAPGTDESLALYTEQAFARLAERLAQTSPTRQDVRAFTRLFYARAQRVEFDSQGRVRIPPELAELARLDKEVVLLGVQDRVEIWAAERWKLYLADRQGHYDEIAETALQ